MRHWAFVAMGSVGVLLVAGCRAATRVSEMPRVDLELTGGNRGYLVGRAPEGAALKTTREMVSTTLEIPSFYKPTRARAPASLDEIAPPEMGREPASRPGAYDTYVVQKGDSLWSIAAKPGVYGKAARWREIFDANRDLLKTPDQLRPGMTLKIPRGDESDAASARDEGTQFKK